jgi:E1A-binding protein p400
MAEQKAENGAGWDGSVGDDGGREGSANTPNVPIAHADPVDGAARIAEWAREEELIEHASDLVDCRSRLPHAEPPRWAEPERAKAAWDHVLGECIWLSTDLSKERSWKVRSARRFAQLVSKEAASSAKIHILSESAPKETAKQISACVKHFWRQAEHVARWRRLQQLEERRQSALDQHLEELLSKTEAYSSSIANSLLLRKLPREGAASEQQQEVQERSKEERDSQHVPSDTHAGSVATEAHANGGLPSGKQGHDRSKSDRHYEYAQANGNAKEDEEDRQPSSKRSRTDDGATKEHRKRKATRRTGSEEEIWETAEWYDIEDTIEHEEDIHEEGELDALKTEADDDVAAIRARLAAAEDEDDDDEESVDEDSEDEAAETEDDDGEEEEDQSNECQQRIENDADGKAAYADVDTLHAKKATSKAEEGGSALQQHTLGKSDQQQDQQEAAEIPFIMKGTLRPYQLAGLDWLTTLYDNRLNGILADEMGLGKTIQTIALLSWLACEKGIWGPHLVVAPTSVLVNWEAEFKRWAPAMRVLSYFGKPEERKQKRKGWQRASSFHVCLTTYTLATQESSLFRKKRWRYLILDEAHLIKNWRSQRWQSLLDLRAARRLLLTGTPLQNRLDELWALLHFLMPSIFASQEAFKRWFSQPLAGVADGGGAIDSRAAKRLHAALRPFLLRRVKQEVERELPQKHEHLIRCKLARRQRRLYEEHVRSDETQRKLLGGNPLGPLHVLMELRKICNHPDLLSPRMASSPFSTVRTPLIFGIPSLMSVNMVSSRVPLSLHLYPSWLRRYSDAKPASVEDVKEHLITTRSKREPASGLHDAGVRANSETWRLARMLADEAEMFHQTRLEQQASDIQKAIDVPQPVDMPPFTACSVCHTRAPTDLVELPNDRLDRLRSWLQRLSVAQPPALARPALLISPRDGGELQPASLPPATAKAGASSPALRSLDISRWITLPDTSILQQDSGKLQALDPLLRRLKSSGSRAVIFTQMSKVLDILESFLNMHGHRYVRLDGNTSAEQRQKMVERFNNNSQLLCCLASTRTGGVGVNLTGANTVIFFDSDWNPAQDAQAQDRTHRIGQTRDVHVYRLVTEGSVEANVLTKQLHKRNLGALALSAGNQLTTDHRTGGSMITGAVDSVLQRIEQSNEGNLESMLAGAEDAEDVSALKNARSEQKAEQDQLNEEVGNQAEENNVAGETGQESKQQQEEQSQSQQQQQTDGSVAIETLLRPFELYALRFLEDQNSVAGLADVEAQVAREEAEWRQQEHSIELRREHDEAAAEGEDTEGMASIEMNWDKERARERYRSSLSNAQSLAMHAFSSNATQPVMYQETARNGYHVGKGRFGTKRKRCDSQQHVISAMTNGDVNAKSAAGDADNEIKGEDSQRGVNQSLGSILPSHKSQAHWPGVIERGEGDSGLPPRGRLASASEYLLPEGANVVLQPTTLPSHHQSAPKGGSQVGNEGGKRARAKL